MTGEGVLQLGRLIDYVIADPASAQFAEVRHTAVLLIIFKTRFLSEELKRHVDLELFIIIYYVHVNYAITITLV